MSLRELSLIKVSYEAKLFFHPLKIMMKGFLAEHFGELRALITQYSKKNERFIKR
jgi:hypothetical protein